MSRFVGQWLGESQGYPSGKVLADFDLVEGYSNGTIYLFHYDGDFPCSAVDVFIDRDSSTYTAKCKPIPFMANSGVALADADLPKLFPEQAFPKEVEINIELVGDDLAAFNWKSEVETHGSGQIKRSIAPKASTIKGDSEVRSWDDFKRIVADANFGDLVFRGQSKPLPLQSSFHRTPRKNLHRYLNNDVPQLHRALTGRVGHLFDLQNRHQFGAFLNLAQHHGFPTPLLDWTYSPYIAAWFAFSDLTSVAKEGAVRVFALNKKTFTSEFPQLSAISFCGPHFSVVETLSLANDRAVPQQGLLTLTNLQNVEDYLIELQAQLDEPLISAYDIPVSERATALNDLAMMGITRSTLFPGAESICLDMKDRLFPQ